MEHEIDLRPYLYALLRGWKLIVGLVAVAVAAAVVLTILQPTRHQASAQLLVVPATSQVSLDARFTTRDATLLTNAGLQRQALIDLATSPVLEARVAEALGVSGYEPGSLVGRMSVVAASDLIRITVADANPSEAAQLAETWARTYETLVNELYTGSVAQEEQIATQLQEAEQRYDQAQQSLDQFLAEGGLVAADQEVLRLEGLLAVARDAQQVLYSDYLKRTRELNLILEDARILREQAASGDSSALADGLGSLVLRARLAGDSIPIQLNLSELEGLGQTRESILADLEQFIAVLQRERDRIVAEAERLGTAIASGQGSADGFSPEVLASYERELAAARGELERLTARKTFLTQRRDIALASLEVLQRKSDELQIAQTTSQVNVRYVGSGLVPPVSLARSLVVSVVLAGVLATALSVAVVVARELLQRSRAGVAGVGVQGPQADRPTDQPAGTD